MTAALKTMETFRADGALDLIRAEHRALGVYAERLDQRLADLAGGAQSAAAEVQPLLQGFCNRLLAHLAAEEDGGVLERAVSVAPHFARRVELLRHEHGQLRCGFEALTIVLDSESGVLDWAGFHARFVALRSALEAHEQAENDILQRTYLEDHGGGD